MEVAAARIGETWLRTRRIRKKHRDLKNNIASPGFFQAFESKLEELEGYTSGVYEFLGKFMKDLDELSETVQGLKHSGCSDAVKGIGSFFVVDEEPKKEGFGE